MKTWLITGCSKGLGKALSEAVLAAGDRLVATARNSKELTYLRDRYGDLVRVADLDVTNDQSAQDAVNLAMQSFGSLDIVVNNAGYGELGSVEETSLTSFRSQIETNLLGTIIVTKAAIPTLRAQRRGNIIQVSSTGGRIGAPARAAYSAAKWGVEGFSESLSREMKLIGVHVTIVEPGGLRTDFARSSDKACEGRPEYDAVVGATIRMQRQYHGQQPGDPAKAASVIMTLANMDKPPLRIALGSDAVQAIEAADEERFCEIDRWRSLSRSIDF
ncbi:MAG: oxidoreductase [Tardiphaga sp.]|uniref:SDR family NAD(P)-dependent oxidoreductase n=1 Tax=Tardiphaga sp. TaxID=1926292 RepID=UPI00260573C4|nr:SDR family NAD(P)-dependent oxidoreductase [Tardiphaga sp.]MDB5503555.1 oxidoreductase [Tardiphaga sp.]